MRLCVLVLAVLAAGLPGCETLQEVEERAKDRAVGALKKGLDIYCDRLTPAEQLTVDADLKPRGVDCGES